MARTSTAAELRSQAILECERVGIEGVRGMLAGMLPADRNSKLTTPLGEPNSRVLYWEAAVWLQQQDAAALADAEDAAAAEDKTARQHAETAAIESERHTAIVQLAWLAIAISAVFGVWGVWVTCFAGLGD
jgi:hypothetical protein